MSDRKNSGGGSSSHRLSSSPSSSAPHQSLPGLLRKLPSRQGGQRGGSGGGGSDDPFDESGVFSPHDGDPHNNNKDFDPRHSLYDLMTEADRMNSLELIGSDKLLRIKRGLWFIIRGQKIHTLDGIAEFFEQIKEEMQRQQIRDESSRAGGTASLVESMMSTLSTSSSAFGQSLRAESMKSAARDAAASVDDNRPRSSSLGSVGSNPSIPWQQQSSSSALSSTSDAFSGGGGGGPVVRASPLLMTSAVSVTSSGGSSCEPGGATTAGTTAQQDSQEHAVSAAGSGDEGGEARLQERHEKEEEEALQHHEPTCCDSMFFWCGAQERHQEEMKRGKRQHAYHAKVRTVLENPLENEQQQAESDITNFIERFGDAVSLFIVVSQLFVLLSTCFHFGFNVPVSLASIVCDKLFGDLVALVSFVYRCVAPWKEHGMWHFDKWERTKRYAASWMIVDFIGWFPLDLVGYGLGWRCALFRPDRCDLVAPQFQLNRLMQCRGMFTNFGSVAETLFLRRGLHPILGRVVEVFLYLLALTHIVTCFWNFLLSRGDKAGLTEYYDAGFEDKQLSYQYFLVMDWSLKSLVGLSPRGTSFPPEMLDQWFVIVLTVFGVAVFANVIATIKLYFDRDCPEKFQAQLIDETIDMIQYMHLKDDFRDECLDYFNHMFKARFHMHGMKYFEDDLAGGLARKLRFIVGRDIVSAVPLLMPLQDNEPFIVSLMQRIEPMVLPPDTVLFKRDDPGSTMLVIVKGTVKVLNPADDTTVVATLGPGKVVGEVALLLDAPRTATVVTSNEFINVMSLDRRQLSELVMLFPEVAPILMKEMARRMHELRGLMEKKQKKMNAVAATAAVPPHVAKWGKKKNV